MQPVAPNRSEGESCICVNRWGTQHHLAHLILHPRNPFAYQLHAVSDTKDWKCLTPNTAVAVDCAKERAPFSQWNWNGSPMPRQYQRQLLQQGPYWSLTLQSCPVNSCQLWRCVKHGETQRKLQIFWFQSFQVWKSRSLKIDAMTFRFMPTLAQRMGWTGWKIV